MDEYYWKPEDFEDVKSANSLADILGISLRILGRMPNPVVMVAGPISTGGRGSIQENLKVLEAEIKKVRASGKTVFNQLPFEGKFSELALKSGMIYFSPVLEEVYRPIFNSGRLSKIYFIKNWETSTGAKWEYDMAGKLGIERVLLD
jgi:hypothetical protein